MMTWTALDIPPQQGRVAIVTGTGGLGYEDALALARAGAEVILAGRNAQKGAQAVAAIGEAVPRAALRFERLDLASLASVADFVGRVGEQTRHLDLLINNAGIMVPPQREVSADGLELQLATNYLGHFALTAGLMPLLQHAKNARVVTVSSIAARNGIIDLGDLNAERSYDPMRTYAQSKLACLMFALELHRRSREGGWGVASMAAHPGISRTDLLHNAPGRRSIVGLSRSLFWFLFQPASQGALPTLFAATSPAAASGHYYGPSGMQEMRGVPAEAKIPPQALDADLAARLWDMTAELVGTAPAPARRFD